MSTHLYTTCSTSLEEAHENDCIGQGGLPLNGVPKETYKACDESHESELFLLKHIDTKGHSVLDSFRSILFLKEIPRDQREDDHDTCSSWVSFVRRVSGHRRPPGEHIIFSAVQSCVKHSC